MSEWTVCNAYTASKEFAYTGKKAVQRKGMCESGSRSRTSCGDDADGTTYESRRNSKRLEGRTQFIWSEPAPEWGHTAMNAAKLNSLSTRVRGGRTLYNANPIPSEQT